METKTTIRFGDGEYVAWLPLPQAIELERKCGSTDRDGRNHPKSLFELYQDITDGIGIDLDGNAVYMQTGMAASVQHLNEVIRCGLIGGNEGPDNGQGETAVGPIRALQLVQDYGYPARPASEVAATAWKILHAAIVGIETPKKVEAPAEGAAKPRRSRKAKSSPTAAG